MSNLIYELKELINESLYGTVKNVQDRIQRVKDKLDDVKFKAKAKTDKIIGGEEGTTDKIIGGISSASSNVKRKTISGVGSSAEVGSQVANTDIGGLALAGLGLDPQTSSMVLDFLKQGIDKLQKEKPDATPEQIEKEKQRQLNILRRNKGSNFKLTVTFKSERPNPELYRKYRGDPDNINNTEEFRTPVYRKALSKKDAKQLFTTDIENKKQDTRNTAYQGIEYKIDSIKRVF